MARRKRAGAGKTAGAAGISLLYLYGIILTILPGHAMLMPSSGVRVPAGRSGMTDGSGITTGKCRGARAPYADRLGALIQSVRLYFMACQFPNHRA